MNKKDRKRQKRLAKKQKHQTYISKRVESIYDLDLAVGKVASSIMVMHNDGKEIHDTDYWETDKAKKGLFELSINAGAFRLLVPENHENLIEEFKTGEYCIISRGPSIFRLTPEIGYELLFEDHTEYPYELWLDSNSVWPHPAKSDSGGKFTLSVWTKGCNKVLEMDAYFREVDIIPYMKPLKATS